MRNLSYCQLWLTCGNQAEADKIENTLLAKHLAACVHKLPIQSNFRWQGKNNSSKEVLLVMDSREDLFSEVECEIAKLHSYDTFVLTATLTTKVSKKAQQWLKSELKNV